MKRIRAIRRLILYVFFTGIMYVLVQTRTLFFKTSHPKNIAWRNRCFRIWARGSSRILGIQLQVEGQPPRPPFLLVCNHLSYVDIIILATQLDGRFIAKKEIAQWPFVGRIARSVDTLFVKRENKRDLLHVNQLIQDVLENQEGVVLFAEGTSSQGTDILPLKPSLLACAAANDYPVHYACISYRTPEDEPPAFRSVCWWGGMALAGHFIELLEIRKIYATLVFGRERVQATNRKALAQKLRESMKKHFTPVPNSAMQKG